MKAYIEPLSTYSLPVFVVVVFRMAFRVDCSLLYRQFLNFGIVICCTVTMT